MSFASPPTRHPDHSGFFSLHRSAPQQSPTTATSIGATVPDIHRDPFHRVRHDELRYEFPLAHRRGGTSIRSPARGGDLLQQIASFLFYTCVHAGGLYVGWHYVRPLVVRQWQALLTRGLQTCCCCGATVARDDPYCPACGSRVTESTACPLCSYCGASLLDDRAPFCPECGKPVPNQVVVDHTTSSSSHNNHAAYWGLPPGIQATTIGYVHTSEAAPTPPMSNRSVTEFPSHPHTNFPTDHHHRYPPPPKEDLGTDTIPMADIIPLVPVHVAPEELPLIHAMYVEEVMVDEATNASPATTDVTINTTDEQQSPLDANIISSNSNSEEDSSKEQQQLQQKPPPSAPPG